MRLKAVYCTPPSRSCCAASPRTSSRARATCSAPWCSWSPRCPRRETSASWSPRRGAEPNSSPWVPRQPPHLQKFLRNSGIRPYWHPQVQYEAPPAHPTVQEANTGKSPQLASFRSKTPQNRITRDRPGSARPPPSTALAGFSISRSLHRTRLPAGRAAAIRDSPPGAGRCAGRPVTPTPSPQLP